LQIRSWKKIAARWNRDERAVRNWRERGAPIYRGDDDVYFTDEDELDAWLESRDAGKSDGDSSDLTEQRTRKTKLEADALERKKQLDMDLYVPVEAAEKAFLAVKTRYKQLHIELFNEMLELSDLPPADKEKLQAKLVDGFNEIAEVQL